VSQDAAVSRFATFRSYGVIERHGRKFQNCDLRIGRNIPHAVEDERAFSETTRRCLRLIFTFESINLFLFPSQHSVVHSIKCIMFLRRTYTGENDFPWRIVDGSLILRLNIKDICYTKHRIVNLFLMQLNIVFAACFSRWIIYDFLCKEKKKKSFFFPWQARK